MLTSIQLREEDNTQLLTLPVGVPSSSSPFFVTAVDGLGPVAANIMTSPYATIDGAIFQNASVDTRNIVMNIEIKPSAVIGNDVATHRETIYRYLPPKRPVIITLVKNDYEKGEADTLRIKGFVESTEPAIFSSSTAVQVSLICPDPHFSGHTPIAIPGKTGKPLDVSPFGSATAGFLFDMTLKKPLSKITIEAKYQETLVYTDSLATGDRIRISTVPGDKFVSRTKAGVVTNQLEKLTRGSMSMGLDTRVSSFYVNKGTPEADAQDYSIKFTPKFVGI